MKTLTILLMATLSVMSGYAQGNHVFSGGEIINSSVMDIPASGNITWVTDRLPVPGYFSALDTAAFTGCSDAANINGYIKKYGNNPFIFPVGNGNDLRTLEISSPIAATDAYATAWISGNPGDALDPTSPNAGAHSTLLFAAPIVAVSTAGQWDWQVGDAGNLGAGTTGTGNGLTITVSIPDMTSFANAVNLRLVGWDGAKWIDLSGSATATNNTENSTLSGAMIPGITAIAVGSVSLTLPLKLESFFAAPNNCDALLSWRTSNEINTKEFLIQQSTDNNTYNTVATVKAKGNSTAANYSSQVAQPSGLAYYRLKMVDINGAYTYSNISLCRTNCAVKEYMTVYPNPVITGATLYLSFSTVYKGRAVLSITTLPGQRYVTQPVQVNAGSNLLPINVNTLAAGTYLLGLNASTGERIGTIQKFIKQ